MNKKIKDNIHEGLWTEYLGGAYIASVSEVDFPDSGYQIHYHKAGFPPFLSELAWTLEELEVLMRRVQPDLRKWKVRQ